MPSNKNNQHPPKCVTRRLLETVAIKDLAEDFVCAPISKQFNGPGPSESGPCECEDDDCRQSCCLDRTYEETSRSCLKKEVESLPCEPECKAVETLDAMIDEIASCRNFFRKLATEAQDIPEPRNPQQDSCCPQDPQYEHFFRKPDIEAQDIPEPRNPQQDSCCPQDPQYEHFFQKPAIEAQDIPEPRNPQQNSCCPQDPQYERCAQTQNQPSRVGWCSKHTDMEDNRIEPNKRTEPMIQKSNSVCSKQHTCAPRIYSSREDQSTSKLHAMPGGIAIPPRSLSRNCSAPIAQTACKVKEGRLSKSAEEKLKNKADNKIKFEVTDGKTIPEEKKKKKICTDLFQKILGKKKSDCSCDEGMRKEIKQKKDKKADCFCDEKGIKTADCLCNENAMKGIKKADCFCDEKGIKTADCFCDENAKKVIKKPDCFCDENAMKGIKKADCFCDDEMGKQNKENQRRINSVAITSVNQANTSSKTACPCCFPPAYNQYFNCTGQVSGTCYCDKSV